MPLVITTTGTATLLTAEGVITLPAMITETAEPTPDGEPYEVLIEHEGVVLDLAGNAGTWLDDMFVIGYRPS